MQWLMKTLLKASRLEQGIISFESSQCMIKETIAMGISAVFAQAQKKQIVIETMEFVDHSLYHNPKWTAEVLTNILENAVKYSPQGSVVRIELTPLDIYTKIDIKDEGMGIPREEYNMIFRRFYRGKKAELKEGTGLGLYLAQLIMQKELGYITLTSSDGKGSCFSLFLLQNKTKNLNLCKKQGRH